MNKKSWLWIVLGIAVVVLTFLFVNYSGKNNKEVAPTPQEPNTVIIQNLSFAPEILVVKEGTTVTWTNNDATTHTVTSNDGLFDSGNLADSGKFQFTFTQKGTYKYRCTLHSSMTGTIVVE